MTMRDKEGRGMRNSSCRCTTNGERPEQNASSVRRCATPGNTGKNRMRRLQIIDFSLQELTLYLDMYPECRRALDKYQALRAEREQIVAALQADGVPIVANGNLNRERWDWIDSPWPWEYDFSGNRRD